MRNLILKIATLFLVLSVSFVKPVFADVATTSTSTAQVSTPPNTNQIANVLCSIILILQGRIGRVIALAAIITLGIAFFLGAVEWKGVVTLVIGLGLLFGAKTVALLMLPNYIIINNPNSGTSGVTTPEALVAQACRHRL